MFQIPNLIREELIYKFNCVECRFDDEDYLDDLLRKGIPIHHYLILHKIKRTNFEKINDIELVMLCGAFIYTFGPTCCSLYSDDEKYVIERLNEFIYDELKKYKKK